MSIDLDWGKLDSSLSSYLVDVLNRQLASTPRPSFIGPVEVTSLEFGSVSPDIELVDLRDIYRDFLEDDDSSDSSEREPVKVTEGAEEEDDDEGFEWVSRRAAAYQHLPPHIRYGYGGRGSGPADMFAASNPSFHSPPDMWNSGINIPSLVDFRPAGHTPWPNTPFFRSTPPTPAPRPPEHPEPTKPQETPAVAPQEQPPPAHPNLQVHLHINWPSDMRITLTTSLLINYPSPMFMSLPIKLSVTGLLFTGELAVAYEGERRRVHICILDDQDPYGPAAGARPKRDSTSSANTSTSTIPVELDDDAASILPPRQTKPLPVGQRLLPNIYIESEIGQADKHVLKNVTRVERFIQDVIRKTVEEELVFPNFHTLLMGDP